MKPCIVEQCEKPNHAKGYCGLHYARLVRTGETEVHQRFHNTSVVDRLKIRTEHVGECWVYRGGDYGRRASREGNQYAGIRDGSKMESAHFAAYKALVGPVPSGHDVHHKCSVKACWRPDHLELLTTAEHWLKHHEHPTHCPQGHPYEGYNLILNEHPGGSPKRICRTCSNARTRESKRRARERQRA